MKRRTLTSIGITLVVVAIVAPSALALHPAQDNAGPLFGPHAGTPVAIPGNSFDWGAASVGFAIAAGLFLLMSIGIVLVHRSRKSPLTA